MTHLYGEKRSLSANTLHENTFLSGNKKSFCRHVARGRIYTCRMNMLTCVTHTPQLWLVKFPAQALARLQFAARAAGVKLLALSHSRTFALSQTLILTHSLPLPPSLPPYIMRTLSLSLSPSLSISLDLSFSLALVISHSFSLTHSLSRSLSLALSLFRSPLLCSSIITEDMPLPHVQFCFCFCTCSISVTNRPFPTHCVSTRAFARLELWICLLYEYVSSYNICLYEYVSSYNICRVINMRLTPEIEHVRTCASSRSKVLHCSSCGMSHVSHMNASCHTHMNASCLTYEWVMSHIWMRHVSHMRESRHTHEWVMPHTWMSHVTHTTSHVTPERKGSAESGQFTQGMSHI